MTIRSVRDEDHAEIARLRRQTIRHVNSKDYPENVILSWSARGSAQALREGASKFQRWVALDKDRIIGFCERNFECELSRIYVHRNYLRQGVGSRLLKVAEASLRKQGCKEIRIDSTVTAKDFYSARGYKVVKKSSYKKDKQQPIYEMLKTLR